ncbi:MAG: hypothetical protein R2932_18885 [Caldilineaceae bacterium]
MIGQAGCGGSVEWPTPSYRSTPISINPKAVGIAFLKAGTFIGPSLRTFGMALCAPGVTCLAGSIIAGIGTTYQVAGIATVAVDDFIIPYAKGANGEGFGEFHVNVAQEITENALENMAPVGAKTFVPVTSLFIDLVQSVCIGDDC